MEDAANRDQVLRQKLQAMSDQELNTYKQNAMQYLQAHAGEEISENMRAVITAIRKEAEAREEASLLLNTTAKTTPEIPPVRTTKIRHTLERSKRTKPAKAKKKINKKLIAGACALYAVWGIGATVKNIADQKNVEPPAYVQQEEIVKTQDNADTTFEEPQIEVASKPNKDSGAVSKDPASNSSAEAYSAQEEIVYITETGEKYHKGSCRHLSKSKIEITKEKAINQGYKACGACY